MPDVSIAVHLDIDGEKVTLTSLEPLNRIADKGFEVALPEGTVIDMPSPAEAGDAITKTFNSLVKKLGIEDTVPEIDITQLPDMLQKGFAEMDKVKFSITGLRLKLDPETKDGNKVYHGYYDVAIGISPHENRNLKIGSMKIEGLGLRIYDWPGLSGGDDTSVQS